VGGESVPPRVPRVLPTEPPPPAAPPSSAYLIVQRVFKVVIDECERGFRDVEFEGDEFEAKDELEEEFEAEFGEEPAKKSLKDNEKNEMKEEQE
jgi:hypothetical protein